MNFRTLTSVLALSITVAAPAVAGQFERADGNDRYERRVVMRAEADRARKIGGYNDPITALINVLSGNATEKDVTPGINHIWDVPGYEGFTLYRDKRHE